MGTGEERPVPPLGAPGLGRKPDHITVRAEGKPGVMGGSTLHDTGVPTELLEEGLLEQASPGQRGTVQVDTMREDSRWRNIVCLSSVGGEGA